MSLDERITCVEREVRVHRAIWGVVVVIGAVLIVWGQAGPIPEVITAREFRVINHEGVAGGIFRAGDTGGQLHLADYEQHLPLTVAIQDGNPLIEFRDKQNNTILAMGQAVSGGAAIDFLSPADGTLVVELSTVIQNGIAAGLLQLFSQGETVISAGANSTGEHGVLLVQDHERNALAGLTSNADGGQILVYNKFGKAVASINPDAQKTGVLVLCDGNGEQCDHFRPTAK